jgi:transketolase
VTGPLSPQSWQYRQLNSRAPTLSVLADTLIELAEAGHPIVACTADLQYSNGLIGFARRYPERLIQFGISEQNMVSAAAGLAAAGMMPFAATFASYMALLCCEQIRTDIAYSALPVRLIGHHAGIALGFYGSSHHATEDLAITRAIADLTVVAPADGAQFAAAIRASATHDKPIYYRIARGHDPVVYDKGLDYALGRAITHHDGAELTIIACGTMVHPAVAGVTRALRAAGRERRAASTCTR